MRIIARSTLREFWGRYPETEEPLKAWFADVEAAHWKKPTDIKGIYATVSLLKHDRAVFNIKGNKYRIVVRINYAKSLVFIRFIGTHAEYDRIDAERI